jgi:hypothetical protein
MKLPTFERMRTLALLRRFFRAALQLGRLPSLLGRETLPSLTAAPAARVFESVVVFVCDTERCLKRLAPFDRRLLACCVFEDRTEWEAARRLHRAQSVISRRLGLLLDHLHAEFIRKGLLTPLPVVSRTEEQLVDVPALSPQPTRRGKRKAVSQRTGRRLRRNNDGETN